MKDKVIIHGVEYVPKVVIEPVKVGRWKPEEDERFWAFDCDGDTFDMKWIDGEYDQRFRIGNIYQTEALAIRARDRQLLLVELQDYADQKNVEEEMPELCYFLIKDGNKWECAISSIISAGIIRFINRADVEATIAHFGDRLNLLL